MAGLLAMQMWIIAHGGGRRAGPVGPLPWPMTVVIGGFFALCFAVMVCMMLGAFLESRGKAGRFFESLTILLISLVAIYIPLVVVLVGFVFLMIGVGKLPWPFVPLGLFVMGLGIFLLAKVVRFGRTRVTRVDADDQLFVIRTFFRVLPREYSRSELASATRSGVGQNTVWTLRFRDGSVFNVDDNQFGDTSDKTPSD